MNPPPGKLRGITERGFAPITAGGIHPRGEPRGIEPSRLKIVGSRRRFRLSRTLCASDPYTRLRLARCAPGERDAR